MTAPTAKEIHLIHQLQKNLSDLRLTPEQMSHHYLVRWLRARNHDLRKSEEMLRKSLEWRKENDMDVPGFWTPPTQLVSLSPVKVIGWDRENSPIFVGLCGQTDLKRIASLGYAKDYVRFSAYMFEKLMQACRGRRTPNGNPVTQFAFIVDMNKLSPYTLLSPATIAMVLEALRMFEANYPETMKRGFLVNANPVAVALFNLCRPIMSESSFSKMTLFGTDATQWKAELQESIDPDQLCPRFGGTMPCHYPQCCPNLKPEDWAYITINPGHQSTHQMEVREAGALQIFWSVQVQAFDVSCFIAWSGHIVSEERRISGEEVGAFICDQPGIYNLVFCNRHSRFRHKEIRLALKLLPIVQPGIF